MRAQAPSTLPGMDTNRLIRLPEVIGMTGLSRSAIYRRIANGTFPSQIHLGSRTSAWSQREVAAWVDQQLAAHGREVVS